MEFAAELKKIGLKDKEAAVYLSCLQLGPSSVQTIARKSKVVRATTYVILESLAKMGLVTQYKEGKKTLFSAEPPRQLLRVLEKQEEDIREKQRELEVLLPELQVLVKAAGERPSVRYFEGKEGIRAIRQEILMYTKPGSTICNLVPADHLESVFPEVGESYYRQRVAKGIKSQTIFTTHSVKHKEQLLSDDFSKLSTRIFVSPDQFPSTSALTVFEDRIALSTFAGKVGGVVLENLSMTEMMRSFFKLALNGAKQVGEQQSP